MTEKSSFYIVAIGASAGGLEALERFFTELPASTGCAFVIIQHLSPDYKSHMVQLLARYTDTPVHQAQDGIKVEQDHIYLLPPRKNMTIKNGILQLVDYTRGKNINLPIDIFFRSLAEDQSENAIGIILSGTGSDGSRGIRAIKEQGGMIMAQDDSARFDGMPRSAISTQLVDRVSAPEDMPAILVSYVRHPAFLYEPNSEPVRDPMVKLLALIQESAGIDFSLYKPGTILRRIERRIHINQIADIAAYVDYLEAHEEERQTLFKEFLIGVTRFFRDIDVFEQVQAKFLPLLLNDRNRLDTLRIWIIACSTGEEAYSLAILFHEYMERMNQFIDFKIFATDIDRGALEYASQGVYSESILADISSDRLEKFFIRRGDVYEVTQQIRRRVVFAYHNVLVDPPFSRLDMISCRNMLIYFKPEAQQQVMNVVQFALKPGGLFLMGSSETPGKSSDEFEVLDSKNKLFRYTGNSVSRPVLQNTGTRNLSSIQKVPEFIQPYRTPTSDRQVDDLLKSLVEQTLPPCIVVDDKKRILHAFGDLNDYLKMPTGIQLSLELDNMIRDELSIPLSTAIYRVMEQGKAVNHSGIRVSDHRINLIVKPFWYGRVSKALALIIFSPVTDSPIVAATEQQFDLDNSALQRIRQLEQELQYTKENLQATIEELETSNEELQSTNEELLAANEELQSTNEELHSVNEEMLTVNNEFEEKIRELTALNNDMNNFLTSTEVGTIFLDSKLKLRLFTPASSVAINLMPQDVGRPLSHLSASLVDIDLVEVAKFTLQHHEHQEHKVQNTDGDWLLMRCLPYHTHTEQVDGVVLTFVDITEMENVQVSLRESEERYRLLISSMTEGIVLQNADGEIVMCNQSAEQIMGLSADQMYGRTSIDPRWRSIREDGTPFPGEEHPAMMSLQTGKPQSGVVMGIYKPDGSLTWISINTQPIFYENNRHPYAVASSFLDITELRHAENEIRARERLLVQTQSLAQMGSYSFSYPDGHNEWTQETYHILGLESIITALNLEEFYRMVHEEDRDRVQTHFQAALDQGDYIKIQYRIIRYDDKQIRYVESIGEPVSGDTPDRRRIVGTLHDITERKLQEDALRKSERQYRTLARNLPDTAVFMFDHDLRYLLVEGQFLEKAGYSRKMLEDKTLYEVLPESMRETLLPYYEAPLRGEQITYERATNQGFIYEATATPVYNDDDDDKEIIGGLLVTRDITESREREQELQKARDMAEAANRAKSIFLASMSHELRTPLNAILGFAQVLERDSRLSSKQHEQVQIIDRSGQHLLRLINQVLDISRIEAGQSQLQPEPTDLYQLVDEVSAMMEGIAYQKDLQFNTLIRPGVPHYIKIDANKLRQILINLIGNAIKFTDRGEISLHIMSDVSFLYCDVVDTGRGIPADILPTLFDLYSPPQSDSDYQPDGAGLGLPLSQSFARLMGGDITLNSQVGSGTTAHVSVRYNNASRMDIRSTQGATVLKLTATEKDYHILVVEDRVENRLLLLNLLETVGYQVRVAHNGAEALEIVKEWKPHLVLMDMRMPVMDGYEATRHIKALKNPPVVIALSASAFVQQQRQMYDAGCDDIIAKPFRAEEIYEKFADHLQIEYEYEHSVGVPKPALKTIQPSDLNALSDELLEALYTAVLRLDTAQALGIIDEIYTHNKNTGTMLRQLVADFRYDRIRQVLQERLKN